MTTIYLAGKMRGCSRFNFDRFEEATKQLEALGYDVISPHQLDLDLGFDPNRSLEFNNFSLEDAVRRDTEAIIVCDAVVVLENSEQSLGVAAEVAIARWLGKQVFQIGDIIK